MSTPFWVRVVTRDRFGPGMNHALTRLAFGRPVGQDRIHGPFGFETIYHFVPGELFCLVWWQRKSNGNQHWVLAILEASRTANAGHVMPDVRNTDSKEASCDT